MTDRAEYLSGVRTVVVKLGTQLLSDKNGRLDAAFVASIAAQLAKIRAGGLRVAVVSSGAIGSGLGELGLAKRPADLAALQAVAAIGQRRLMDVWADAFEPHKLHVAQLLLTRQDIDDRSRFLNLRNTILAVHELGGIPIINENDTVSTAELEKISFGDNDILAAMVAHALRADLLVLLTVVDGVLDSDGKPVRMAGSVDDVRKHVRDEKSALGRGGMDSKLQAAQMVTDTGEMMLVADGRMPDLFSRLLAGEEIGTLFAPAGKKRSSRSRWIGSLRLSGMLVVDDGARKALVDQNKSLLPAGIVRVEGIFSRGDPVGIAGADGALIGRGLSNYSSEDMDRIKGKKSQQIRQMLQEGAYDEAVHRDNLVLERVNQA